MWMLAVQSTAMSDLRAGGALAADTGATQAALCLAGAGRKRTAGGDGDDECKRARPDSAAIPAVCGSATDAVDGAGSGAGEGTKDTEADAIAAAVGCGADGKPRLRRLEGERDGGGRG